MRDKNAENGTKMNLYKIKIFWLTVILGLIPLLMLIDNVMLKIGGAIWSIMLTRVYVEKLEKEHNLKVYDIED